MKKTRIVYYDVFTRSSEVIHMNGYKSRAQVADTLGLHVWDIFTITYFRAI